MENDKPNTPSEVKGSTEHNADDAAVNETSQKFDHPRVNEDSLKQDEHYVSLKKIKESERVNGTGTTGSPNSSKSKPEPTSDLEKASPGAREE